MYINIIIYIPTEVDMYIIIIISRPARIYFMYHNNIRAASCNTSSATLVRARGAADCTVKQSATRADFYRSCWTRQASAIAVQRNHRYFIKAPLYANSFGFSTLFRGIGVEVLKNNMYFKCVICMKKDVIVFLFVYCNL